ncbi:hypothetical protein Mkiyose1665_26850 [Mycobacterium kiyosense]|uniref:Uncharacterized protein n=1 Tax=Mycobacterium kiyosense TaxID=2871094 RepID=A0A9P3UTX2_9MYCO|nr:hypothetical protein [Mycobacterium kiyosense]GLB82257.1 hypothetical protein SRL2020028_15130 [Mycobacterium kiyosense]GLB95961.1 hypothetical protein SRL2020226_27370 [Mycobacterium kiyosense]GLD30030.1 hypothetical protein Mkiyose1413_19130 [Mycobacterium kiyosense]GLD35733.1 hypothetical protein Mkiyose1595_19530 [Mycobacterium kiyosense]GLD42185.1 hypothetical protein Mkiyose1665_26850 [Mycobacterium kiyosense]
MADTSHLPPEVLYALRTGKLPPHLLEAHPDVVTEVEESPDDPDADDFRRKYQAMVNEAIEDWLDDNPGNGGQIPTDERLRIEEYCERQIQHQWRMFIRKRDGLDRENDDEGYEL